MWQGILQFSVNYILATVLHKTLILLNLERLTVRLGLIVIYWINIVFSVFSSFCICCSDPARFRYFCFVRWPFLNYAWVTCDISALLNNRTRPSLFVELRLKMSQVGLTMLVFFCTFCTCLTFYSCIYPVCRIASCRMPIVMADCWS